MDTRIESQDPPTFRGEGEPTLKNNRANVVSWKPREYRVTGRRDDQRILAEQPTATHLFKMQP